MSLKERREIVALAREGSAGVLVTLVRAAGSSYRRPGARLLALPDGRTAGTISGGCLEADLLRRAQWRIRDGAVLHTYDTGFEDTAEVPFGLGCGGLVDLLLEDTATPEGEALLHALQATLDGSQRWIATRLPSAGPLQRVVVDDAGDVLFCSESLSTEEAVAMRASALGKSTAVAGDLFLEDLPPAQRLVIFGAGEDARPLARIASELGWTLVVADGRSQQAKTERFPQAEAVRVESSAHFVKGSDAVVLMTHSFEQDRRLLTELLPLAPRFLGLLGARQRSALLLRNAAHNAGIGLAEAVARVHAPVGLQLGGDGPESIALSITAEIQSFLHRGELQSDVAGVSRGMSLQTVQDLLNQFAAAPLESVRCALDLPIETEVPA